MRPGASRTAGPKVDAGFERFVLGYSPILLRSAYLLCGNRAQAEDLLQLTLLRTARRWAVAREAPEAYARRVLVNLSRDRRRWALRHPREYPLDLVHQPALADDPAQGIAERAAVIRALRRLPSRQREVLVLRFYADLSVAETAAAMDASYGTVKSYTSRALLRMRELLADPADKVSPKRAEVPSDER